MSKVDLTPKHAAMVLCDVPGCGTRISTSLKRTCCAEHQREQRRAQDREPGQKG